MAFSFDIPFYTDPVSQGRSNFSGSNMTNSTNTKLGVTSGMDGSNTSSGDTTYSQTPQEATSKAATNTESNVLAYPTDLGTGNHMHYVKFEVFIIKTDNMNLLGGSKDSKQETDDLAIPRFSENLGGSVSEVQKNAVKYTKLQEMIGLPIPDSLLSDYSVGWSKAEGGFISGAVSLADAMSNAESREKLKIGNMAVLTAASGISNLAAQVGMDGAETNLKMLTKRASNPRNEFLFDGVNNRSFNMTWKLIPKDATESENIRNIIEKMKLYMHPELDESTAGKFFIFPAIFDISFMAGSEENEYLHRTSSCALTNMTVNSAGGGMASFFEGTNAPFAIDLIMQFTELEFLHRKRFKTANNPDGVVR